MKNVRGRYMWGWVILEFLGQRSTTELKNQCPGGHLKIAGLSGKLEHFLHDFRGCGGPVRECHYHFTTPGILEKWCQEF